MPILSTALQTLSEMALIESGVQIPDSTDPDIIEQLKADLNGMASLTEEEMRFSERMIPIKASKRLGKYLIEMEDLSRYMMTNKIHSFKEAVMNILEANELKDQYLSTAIVIDEHSILDEVQNLGYNISLDCWNKTPKKGLGIPMISDNQHDTKEVFRKVANTKQLMDILTGRYGIPLIKKNYQQVGLLEEVKPQSLDENSAMLQGAPANAQTLTEEDPAAKDKKKKSYKEHFFQPRNPSSNHYRVDEDNEASRDEQPGDIDGIQEGIIGDAVDKVKSGVKSVGKSIKKSIDEFDGNKFAAHMVGHEIGEKIGGKLGLSTGGKFAAGMLGNAAAGSIYDKVTGKSKKEKVQESSNMSQHDAYIQHLRDIASGKYDDMI